VTLSHSRPNVSWPIVVSLLLLLACYVNPAKADEFVLASSFGTYGSANGQFNDAQTMVIDNGNLFVADLYNGRIQEFTPAGTFLQSTTLSTPGLGPIITTDAAGDIYAATTIDINGNLQGYVDEYSPSLDLIGSFSTPPFLGPIAADAQGDLYAILGVGVSGYAKVLEYSSEGTLINSFGDVLDAYGLAVDSSGNVYVSAFDNNQIDDFSSTGLFTGYFPPEVLGPSTLMFGPNGALFVETSFGFQEFSSSGEYIANYYGQVNNGIAVSSSGDVYVSDYYSVDTLTPVATAEPASLYLAPIGMWILGIAAWRRQSDPCRTSCS
jgi:tripartite motif-containing protein 71